MQEEQQVNQGFNPSDHLMKIKSRQGLSDYLPVQWRLVWFRQECPHGTIETEELEYDTEKECSLEAFVWNSEKRRSEKVVKTAKGYARYRAVVTDGKGGRATGTKAECRANFEDYGEKAETGAIGRALAGLGFGTQFAPELDEEHRIVDSPVERGTSRLRVAILATGARCWQQSVLPRQRAIVSLMTVVSPLLLRRARLLTMRALRSSS